MKKHCRFDDETLKIQALKDDSCYEHENISKTLNVVGELFDDRHQILCETALHSAISLGHKAIVEELVAWHKSTIACRDYTGRTPLHEAVRQNNTEIVKLLLMEDQTKAHSACDQWQNVQGKDEMRKYWTLSHEESFEYHRDICHCGYTPLHLAARYGYFEIAIELVKRGKAKVGARDCFGATPLHVAACHNHLEMVYLLLKLGADMGINAFNGSTPLHSAAACGAVEVIDHLFYYGANLSAVDDSGLTALHYAILNTNSSNLERNILVKTEASSGEQCQLVTFDRTGHLARFFAEENHIKNTDHYRWLDTLTHLIVRGSAIDAVDMYGQTALHIAARNGLADAVNVLLQKKAKLEMCDKSGKTPLEVAVENGIIVPTQRRNESTFTVGKSLDGLREALRDHEMVVYLLLSYDASIKKCNRRNRQTLLHYAVTNNQPHMAQLLLLRNASLTSKDNLRRTPLIAYLHNGGYLMNVVLQHFNVSVTIKCGKPFKLSVFHLMCYRPPSIANLNFFERRECDDHKCTSLKSSFITAIESHRLKYKVIDSCLDAEGFTPLHRAAQGANIMAVRSLNEHDANVSLLSPQGHDALTLAILHAGGNIWLNLDIFRETARDNVSDVAIELLRHKMKTHGFQIVCDSSKAELTLYHLAASRGLVKFIKEILKGRILHQLDVDCPNRDGITPMYLAKVFGSLVDSDTYKPWAEVIQYIKNQRGRMQYLSRNAEYNVIYNKLYGWIPKDFKLKLRPDVGGFVVGLLSTYGYWQNNSMQCQLHSINRTIRMEIGMSETGFVKELMRQLPLLELPGSLWKLLLFALEDIEICHEKQKQGLSLFSKYKRYVRILPPKAQKLNLERAQTRLFYLMRMWYKKVFGDFACFKKVFNTYRPYFGDKKKVLKLFEQYEDSTPLWYLDQICFHCRETFKLLILHYLEDVTFIELPLLYHGYPNFIRERMEWSLDQSRHNESWPLEFVVKSALGYYRQYDYLKVLNIGLELKTHISLYSDKIKQVFATARKK